MKIIYVLVLVCYFVGNIVECARILSVLPFPSYSHQVVYKDLVKELALKGHEVVTITTDPVHDHSVKYLKEIDISFAYNLWRNRSYISNMVTIPTIEDIFSEDFKIFQAITEKFMEFPEVKALLNQHFDLVLVEFIYPASFAYSVKFNCPLVGISSIDLLDPLNQDIGNPIFPTVYPSFALPFSKELSLWERFTSVKFSLWFRRHFDNVIYPSSDRVIQKYFGKNFPPAKEIVRNVSMVFVNSNPLFVTPKANVPTLVEVTGLHTSRKAKPLPQDIQNFLNDATEGFVYLSFGSNVRSSGIPKAFKQLLADTFRELPYKILWKLDDSNVTNLSDNVKMVQWVSQQAVLEHRNIKVFITQGGLQSMEEAIRKRVPMIGVPFYVDQFRNVKKIIKLGIGLGVDKSTVTKEEFKKTITEVAENSIYKKRVKEAASILEEEPIKSMDKVIWWIEYIIRHKGAVHLRSPFLDVPWYQYLYFDLLAFLCTGLILTILFIVYVIRKITQFINLNYQTKRKSE